MKALIELELARKECELRGYVETARAVEALINEISLESTFGKSVSHSLFSREPKPHSKSN